MASDVCGYDDTTTGHPCQQPAGENGRCHIPSHNPGPDNDNPGRPTKLEKDTVDTITSSIAEGKSINSAARMAGIHPSTVGNWMDRAEAEYEGDLENVPMDPDFDTDPYGYFFRRYVRARGLGEDAYVQDILDMAREDLDTATLLSMLKQRYGDSWGEVNRGEQAAGVVVNLGEEEEYEVDPETLAVENPPDGVE